MIRLQTFVPALLLLFVSVLSCNSESKSVVEEKPPPAEEEVGPYLLTLEASARVEATSDWPKNWANKAQELKGFARECGALGGALGFANVAVGDFNGDQAPDIIASGNGSPTYLLFHGVSGTDQSR